MSLLEVRDLRLVIENGGPPLTIIDGISLWIDRGEALGLVGESGSGKSMTARSITGLLPEGARVEGKIAVRGA